MTRPTDGLRRSRRASLAATAMILTLATLAIYAQGTPAPQGRPAAAQPANPLDKPGALAKENLAKPDPNLRLTSRATGCSAPRRTRTTAASATCRCRS